MSLVRWNDDRLDSFAADVSVMDTKVDHMVLDVNTLKGDMDTLKGDRAQGINSRFQWWMIGATAISSPLTALVVWLITKGK